MSVRIKEYNTNAPTPGDNSATEYLDDTIEQRTLIDNEGYTYNFGPNVAINVLDEGRGITAVASANNDNIVQDTVPFGQALS